ncbi:MAG: hypothetical protein ACRDPH_10440 [Marmoricola sp.]
MNATTVAALIVAVVALLGSALLLLLWRRERRRAAALLARGREESAAVRQRLDTLALRVDAGSAAPPATAAAEFLITDAGTGHAGAPEKPVPGRVVFAAAWGEPLLRAVALGHGVRHALSPRVRNRIWFEMKREVRAARKQRKREVRAHLRDLRAARRADEHAA